MRCDAEAMAYPCRRRSLRSFPCFCYRYGCVSRSSVPELLRVLTIAFSWVQSWSPHPPRHHAQRVSFATSVYQFSFYSCSDDADDVKRTLAGLSSPPSSPLNSASSSSLPAPFSVSFLSFPFRFFLPSGGATPETAPSSSLGGAVSTRFFDFSFRNVLFFSSSSLSAFSASASACASRRACLRVSASSSAFLRSSSSRSRLMRSASSRSC